ncbi:MAG: alpha/beta fold hydrolase [Chthoniobacterales bacterium]
MAVSAASVLCLAAVALVLVRASWQRRAAARLRISAAEGIYVLEKVRLGGIEQWVLIRGQDVRKPVLLFLHGGPGFPAMPFSHTNAELERDFVVVNWDQRAAGKSYTWSIPDDSMRVAQFVSDAHELVQWLQTRLGVRKVYLVAHSWGSLFGAQLVAQHPELFFAYVGIGQAADLRETEQVRYQYALEAAHRESNQKASADLGRIGRPPHSAEDHEFMEKWVHYYSEREHSSVSRGRMVRLALSSPEYSWIDLIKIPLGAHYSLQRLWKEIFYETNLSREAPRLEVPVYFFLGRHDRVVTWEVAQRYFDSLDAPRGKQLIWFEDSGHWPQFEESQKYRNTLVQRVLAETAGRDTR